MSHQLTSFPPLHKINNLDQATLDDLSLLVQSFPVIDNHAHNLLSGDHASGTADILFESITSEAQGIALTDHVHSSLSHIRATKQLALLYGCPETMRDIKAARFEWVGRDYRELVKACLEGTHGIMMDDGLNKDVVLPYKWHRHIVPQVSRIVRIETVAAEILEQLVLVAGLLKPGTDTDWERNQTEALFIRFNAEFRNQIRAFASNSDVRGFKSVICYRTGLDIGLASKNALRPQQSFTESELLTAFHEFLQQAVIKNSYRVQKKAFNDYLVVAVCEVLDKRAKQEGGSLPLQFHTGLGDSDINLITANPAHLQPLIEAFPSVDFVLLHSSYPYTREAGYLASVYPNAWLDIGEAFPMLSRDGQESMLKQALELAPTSKILWSTDGHFFPETYWLANRQFREALNKMLHTGVVAGDYTIAQAISIAVDIMFWNSNSLYNLGEERKYPHLVGACGRTSPEASMRTLVNRSSAAESTDTLGMQPPTRNGHSQPMPNSGRPRPTEIRSIPTNSSESSDADADADTVLLDAFLAENVSVKYVWLAFLDYTATQRQRMVPVAAFRKQLVDGSYIGITKALMRLLQDDNMASGGSVTEQFLLKPDVSTITLNKGLDSPSATVQTWWLEDASYSHLEGCPRWTLQKQVDFLKSEYNISLLMGFEIEIIFMRPQMNESTNTFTDFLPLPTLHSWSNMTFSQLDTLPMIEEIVSTLAEVNIHILQFHTEAAPGQWEFPLPATEPLKAIDMLYTARAVIRNVARKHGLKATLYPRPYDYTCGSACHTHFSLHGGLEQGRNTSIIPKKQADSFIAGILDHLPSIVALTLPIEESYERVKAGIWAGGEYVAWGSQNREVPLRKCGRGGGEEDAHWEFKSVDGMSNMYFGIAALLAAGMEGLRSESQLTQPDCVVDPGRMTAVERRDAGIVKTLPRSLKEALVELEKDVVLRRSLGDGFVQDYLAVKRAEMEKWNGMGKRERRIWLVERY